VDGRRVERVVGDPRVKARPAFHYRLPNCEIDVAGWGIHVAWRDWLEVERLAAEEGRLADLCRRFSTVLERPMGTILDDWTGQVSRWLDASGDR
jgi:hypothetical protein